MQNMENPSVDHHHLGLLGDSRSLQSADRTESFITKVMDVASPHPYLPLTSLHQAVDPGSLSPAVAALPAVVYWKLMLAEALPRLATGLPTMAEQSALPSSFLESKLSTKAEYEASLVLQPAARMAAEYASASMKMLHRNGPQLTGTANRAAAAAAEKVVSSK